MTEQTHAADAVAAFADEASKSLAPSWWASMSAAAASAMGATPAPLTPAVTPQTTVAPIAKPIELRGRSWLQWLQLSVGGCATAGLAYALYRRANSHHAYVTITECVSLPPETSGDFVELGLPLEGEVRMDCSTLTHCKYQLKLNTTLKAETGRVKGDPSSATNSRASATTLRNSVTVGNVNKSELCDAWLSDYTGNLHFSPSCVTNDALLMTYSSTTHESLQPAVSVRDCWVEPAASAMTHRLSFNLHVYSSVMDLAVTMILPKGSRILKVSSGGKGTVTAASMFVPHELTWNVGTFTREPAPSGSPGRSRTVLRQQGATNDAGRVNYDTIPDINVMVAASKKAASQSPSTLDEEADMTRTLGPSATSFMSPPVERDAHEQMMAMTDRSCEVVPFELVYTINLREAEDELNRGRTASQATAAFVANNRRERRQMEKDRRRRAKKQNNQRGQQYRTHGAVEEMSSDDDADEGRLPADLNDDASHITFDPSEHTPGVHLTYATQSTASGLSVRKLLTSAEVRNYNLLEDLLGPAPSLEEGSAKVTYTRKQAAARSVINGVGGAVIGTRKRFRRIYRSIYSTITRRPIALSPEEIADEMDNGSTLRSADVTGLYGPNVRVPTSIVKMKADQPALGGTVRDLQTTYGRNPFGDHHTVDDNDYVHVNHEDQAHAAVSTPTVAFNLHSEADVVPVVVAARPPKETFVDHLIKQHGVSTPKLHKKVRYITRYSQQVRVSAQF